MEAVDDDGMPDELNTEKEISNLEQHIRLQCNHQTLNKDAVMGSCIQSGWHNEYRFILMVFSYLQTLVHLPAGQSKDQVFENTYNIMKKFLKKELFPNGSTYFRPKYHKWRFTDKPNLKVGMSKLSKFDTAHLRGILTSITGFQIQQNANGAQRYHKIVFPTYDSLGLIAPVQNIDNAPVRDPTNNADDDITVC